MAVKVKPNYRKILLSDFALTLYSVIALSFTSRLENDLRISVEQKKERALSSLRMIKNSQAGEIERVMRGKTKDFEKYKNDRLKILKKEFSYKKVLVINYEKLTKEKVVNRLNKDLFFISKLIEKLIYKNNQELLYFFYTIRTNISAGIDQIENSHLIYE